MTNDTQIHRTVVASVVVMWFSSGSAIVLVQIFALLAVAEGSIRSSSRRFVDVDDDDDIDIDDILSTQFMPVSWLSGDTTAAGGGGQHFHVPAPQRRSGEMLMLMRSNDDGFDDAAAVASTPDDMGNESATLLARVVNGSVGSALNTMGFHRYYLRRLADDCALVV